METKVVCYYRVSTTKQGLGLGAQKQAVAEYLTSHPEIKVIGEFTETFSGKEASRPAFREAIELCKRSGATLLSAKLDRIGRGKFLYTMLGDGSVKFKALDITGDSEIEKAIRVAIAIEERNKIASRTSDALQAKAEYLRKAGECYNAGNIEEANKWVELAELKSRNKRGLDWWVGRGFRLGSVRSLNDAHKASMKAGRSYDANNDDANINAKNAIGDYLQQGGKRSYSGIASFLNENNYKTRRGKAGGWKPQSVKNLMERFNL